jgi:hypothetical protein
MTLGNRKRLEMIISRLQRLIDHKFDVDIAVATLVEAQANLGIVIIDLVTRPEVNQ